MLRNTIGKGAFMRRGGASNQKKQGRLLEKPPLPVERIVATVRLDAYQVHSIPPLKPW